MVEGAKSWFKENATLVYFLIAQFIALGIGGASMLAYFTKLEERVHILEVRGSPHLAEINNRLTVTEKETQKNSDRVDRVVDIMTRELGKTVPPR
jgi:uncharacterized coiled-coil protein SlyX